MEGQSQKALLAGRRSDAGGDVEEGLIEKLACGENADAAWFLDDKDAVGSVAGVGKSDWDVKAGGDGLEFNADSRGVGGWGRWFGGRGG
jgi:hypothetical protein